MTDPFPHDGLVDVRAVAAFLSVGRDWVYDNKLKLGAVKIGGALRFEAHEIREYVRLNREQPKVERPSRARARDLGFEILRAA